MKMTADKTSVLLNLKVSIDAHSGFCFGVVYAIAMAEAILDSHETLYCLGDIVHNDEEVKRLGEKGLRVINHDDLETLHNAQVLIRAHGEPPETYRIALKNNITLIDASCPVVLKLQHRIKQSYDRNETILIYGKPGHAEVIGLQGQTQNKAIIFQDIQTLTKLNLPDKITLYSQTTKDLENFLKVKDKLLEMGYDLKVNDTICKQVSNRNKTLSDFVKNFHKIVFVAGKKSSNGHILYNICKKHNENSIFISSISEIRRDMFQRNESVGICGATSTPMWLMEKVKSKLSEF